MTETIFRPMLLNKKLFEPSNLSSLSFLYVFISPTPTGLISQQLNIFYSDEPIPFANIHDLDLEEMYNEHVTQVRHVS